MNFGEYIKGIRKEKGLSMREVERRTTISQAYLSQIESGKRNTPKPEMIKELANGLDVEYVDLMKKAGYVSNEEEIKKSLKAGFGTGLPVKDNYEFIEEENNGHIQKLLVGKGETSYVYPAAYFLLPETFSKINPFHEKEILEFICQYGELGRKHLPQKLSIGNNKYLEEFEPETLDWIQLHIKTVRLVIELFSCIKESNEELIIKVIEQYPSQSSTNGKFIKLASGGGAFKEYYEMMIHTPISLAVRIIQTILNENIKIVRREFTFSNNRLDSYFVSDSLIGIIYWQLANMVQSEGVTGHS